MKRVVSISLGSSKRDHKTVQEFCGEKFTIERIGTDGDKDKAVQLIKELDGKVDAFGMGGTDLYIYAGNRRYTFRESEKIAAAAHVTPIVDGSGIKNTLERRVIRYLEQENVFHFAGKRTLVVCAVDRFGMAEALAAAGSKVVFGDLMFGLGIRWPIYSVRGLSRLARVVAPVITRLPIQLFYPTGAKQNENIPRFSEFFQEADVVAGDFHFIRRYMPQSMPGKLIITNTVTAADEALLQDHGVTTLVTTTPDMGGRSFGTNVLEAILVTIAGKRPDQLMPEDYSLILDQIGVQPRVSRFAQ